MLFKNFFIFGLFRGIPRRFPPKNPQRSRFASLGVWILTEDYS